MARTGLRSHFAGSVPISIAMHVVALLGFLIVSLTGTLDLPEPVYALHLPDSILVVPPPPPPPAPVVRDASRPATTATAHTDIAPTVAPDAIRPEAAPPGIPEIGL